MGLIRWEGRACRDRQKRTRQACPSRLQSNPFIAGAITRPRFSRLLHILIKVGKCARARRCACRKAISFPEEQIEELSRSESCKRVRANCEAAARPRARAPKDRCFKQLSPIIGRLNGELRRCAPRGPGNYGRWPDWGNFMI